MLMLADRVVDLDRAEVFRGDEVLARLTPGEVQVLRRLAASPGELVTQQTLLVDALGYAPTVESRAVALTVSRLRKKLEADPTQPLHVVNVYGRGYRFDPLPELPHDLVGRTGDVGRLRAALAAHALVSLIGPAGVGKTALARAVCPGALWVDLHGCETRADVLQAVGRVVDVRGPEHVAHALAAIRGRTLVLDNAEQALEVVAELVVDWSAFMPVLVTSRVPAGGGIVELAPLERAHADTLIRRLAARQHPPPRLEDLTPLLDLLDGLPLALELAASRLTVLTPTQLADRIGADGGVLRGGTGRFDSLSAAISASFYALSPADQRAAAALSVFPAGVPVEVAEALAGGLDGLQRLVRGSLISPWTTAIGDRRFRLLESIRGFCGERATDVDRGRAHAAMLGHAEVLAHAAYEELGRESLARLGIERPNLWVIARRGGPELRVRAALAMGPLQRLVSTSLADATLLEGLLETATEAPERIALLLAAAEVGRTRGEVAHARGWLAEAVERTATVGDPELTGLVWDRLGTLQLQLGELAEAEDSLGRARILHQTAGVARREANVVRKLGLLDAYAGRLDRAEGRLRDAIRRFRRLGRAWDMAVGRGFLAHVLVLRGEPQEAVEVLRDALDCHRAAGNRLSEGTSQGMLGIALGLQGDWSEAATALRAAVKVLREAGALRLAAHYLGVHAELEVLRGDLDGAEALAREQRGLADVLDDQALGRTARETSSVIRHLRGDAARPALDPPEPWTLRARMVQRLEVDSKSWPR